VSSASSSRVSSPDCAQRDLVVLCDDEIGNRLAFRAVLELAGFRVIAANDAAEAVEQSRGLVPAVILLRVKNARTARDTLTSFVTIVGTEGIPIVAVSSNIYLNEKALEAAGFRALIRIPAAPRQIELSVRRSLEAARTGAAPGWIRLPPPHEA